MFSFLFFLFPEKSNSTPSFPHGTPFGGSGCTEKCAVSDLIFKPETPPLFLSLPVNTRSRCFRHSGERYGRISALLSCKPPERECPWPHLCRPPRQLFISFVGVPFGFGDVCQAPFAAAAAGFSFWFGSGREGGQGEGVVVGVGGFFLF